MKLNSIIHFLLHTLKGRIILVIGILLIWFWFSLPEPIFKEPTSTVLVDRSGILLGAKISADKQWRFPLIKKVPYKFEKAIIQFEDRNFYYHPGINPLSLGRAIIQDIKKRRLFSGGSTISMQVIRLSRKGKHRTFLEKFIEIILAMRLELRYSKNEILALYTSYAPFGGNVVGLEAASWRYFGRPPEKLSWSETASIAVLPNSHSLIFPGKNHNKFLQKRNRLLARMYKAKIIDEVDLDYSKKEPLPAKPLSLPQLSPHLLERVINEGHVGKYITSTLDAFLQDQVNDIVEREHIKLKANDVNNIAVLVLDVNTGNVLSYVGNTNNKDPQFGSYVDVIDAPRSTGSILKPFLYAAMINEGAIVPTSLIPDIPTQINGYVPLNYSQTFDGAIPAKHALARSLNVPAVRMLQMFGIDRFNFFLKKFGITTINKPAMHYGLSIILGGAEGKLWDLSGIYASMARTLNNYNGKYKYKYLRDDFHPPLYMENKKKMNSDSINSKLENSSFISASSIWQTFDAMMEVARPDEEFFWQQFSSSSKIAWKTGTSYGNRDAWAIGTNPNYVVGVWVGNADGEGRPEITGINVAAPILFEIFKILKPSGWFDKPYNDMIKISVCHQSGYKASPICEDADVIWVSKNGNKVQQCPYHQIVHLDRSERYIVNSECESVSNMVNKSWFTLPPVMEYYFKMKNPFYKTLPQWRSDCNSSISERSSMEFIYPKTITRLYIPVEFSGELGKTVFRVAHRNPGTTIYWHLDDKYIGSTTNNHQMELSPEEGKHVITLIDQNGESLSQRFEILKKQK